MYLTYVNHYFIIYFKSVLSIQFVSLCKNINDMMNEFINTVIFLFLSVIMLTLGTNNYFQYKRLALSKGVRPNFFKWLITFIFFPITGILFYIFFGICKLLVSFILRFRLGNRYGGMISSQDSMFTIEYPEQMIIPVLFVVQSDKNPEEFYETTKAKILNKLNTKLRKNIKIRGSLNYSMGYVYITKDAIKVEDCIKELKTTANFPETMTKSDVFKLNEEYCGIELPKYNTGFWDVWIGKQKVLWRDSEEDEELSVYPIIFRFSHCLGDGFHLFNGVVSLFGDVDIDSEIPKKCHKEVVNVWQNVSHCIITIRYIVIQILCYFQFIPSLLVNYELLKNYSSSLYGPKLNKKTHMCVSDKISSKYLNMAKNIKKRLSKCTLTDVFLAAFSASLSDYLKKYDSHIPDSMTCGVTSASATLTLRDLNPKNVQLQKIECTNRVNAFIIKLPTLLYIENQEAEIMKIFEDLSRQRLQIYESQEVPIHFWLVNVMLTNFPLKLYRYLSYLLATMCLFSNIPGIKMINVLDGSVLKQVISFCPNRTRTGIGLAAITYDEKLCITLQIDTKLIHERCRVQEILDGVYQYLEIFDRVIR